MTVRRVLATAVPIALLLASCGDSDPEPSATFSAPTDGASIAGGVPLTMAAEGVTIEEAGEVHDNAGHFHVIADAGCLSTGTAVPKDADHVHFGKGQSEGTIYLEPGSHELCLQVGDGVHSALDLTDTVTVDVGISDRDQWCAVVEETDGLFTANDGDEIEFAVRQVGYENVLRLIAQLADGLDHVDADVRDDVAEAIDFGRIYAQAYVDSDDYQGVEAALTDTYGDEGVQSDGPGSTWILDTCGVDIDG